MLYSRVRFLAALLLLGLGIIFQVKMGFASSWYFFLGGTLLLATHFLFGTVFQAFTHLKKGNIDQAEYIILSIKKPGWLVKNNRAYYHFIRGMIALQKKQDGFGEQFLKKALDLGLRNETDNALAALNIAHVHFVKKEWEIAKTYLEKTKSFGSNDLMILENIEKLEKTLAHRKP